MRKTIFYPCFLVFFILPLFVFAQPEKDEPEIPPPPKSTPRDDARDFTLGGKPMTGKGYLSLAKEEEIVGHYKKFFKENEFSEIIDKPFYDTGVRQLRFKKDDKVIEIVLLPGKMSHPPEKEGIIIGVIRYNQKTGEPNIEQAPLSIKDNIPSLPREDKPGTDLFCIPRPPKGIRILGEDLGVEFHVMYSTPITVQEACEFYAVHLPYMGWALEKSNSMKKIKELYEESSYSGEKINIPNVFGDGTSLNDIVSGSYVLDFQSPSYGKATITVYSNIYGKDSGSTVFIVLRKRK